MGAVPFASAAPESGSGWWRRVTAISVNERPGF
jgi:hypothetical protein